MFNKKIFLFALISLIFLIGTASADLFGSWDNQIGVLDIGKLNVTKNANLTIGNETLTYNPIWEKYEPVTITDVFGFGSVLLDGAITEHTETGCSFNCVSEMELYLTQATELIQDIRFYHVDEDGNEVEKPIPYDLKIATAKDVIIVPDYNISCTQSVNKNGSIQNDCVQVMIGSHKEVRYTYQKYNIGDPLPPGTYHIKLEGNKDWKDTIDWQIKTQGKWITEWAKWGVVNSWTNWTFDSSANWGLDTGTDAGAVGNIKFTGGANATGVNCIDLACLKRTGGYGTVTNPEIDHMNGTLSFWINSTDLSANQGIWQSVGGGVTSSGIQSYFKLTTGTLHILVDGGGTEQDYDTGINITAGQWSYIAIKINGTGVYAYQNGSLRHQNIAGGKGFFRPGGTASYATGIDTIPTTVATFDEWKLFNVELSDAQILDIYNTEKPFSFPQSANTTLFSPANAFSTTSTLMNFSVNSTSQNINMTNVTLYIWNATSNALLYSNTTAISGANISLITNWTNVNLSSEGDFIWGATTATQNSTLFGISSNRTFFIDFTPPTVVLNANISNQIVSGFPINVSLNFTASDPHLSACYYNSTDNATQTVFPCNTTVLVPISSAGNKSITFSANDTTGSSASGTTYFQVGVYSLQELGDPVAEGGTGTFNLTINYTNIPSSSAYLTYNNTIYSPTSQASSQNQTIFGYILTVPQGFGNSTGKLQFYNWTFNVTGVTTNQVTTTANQTVIAVSLSDCSAGGTVILNFTQQIEENRTIFPISNVSTNNLQVDLSLTSLADSSIAFNYNSTVVNNASLIVCVPNGVLNFTSYRLDLTGSYVGTNYVQEFFYIDNGTVTLASSPQRYNWFDLALADSTTFLFTFFDENGLEVPGVIIHTLRYYIGQGQFIEVERSKEDNNGETHIHLVEEDVIYQFNVTLNGAQIFLSDQYNAKCLSSPCSITLSAEPQNEQFPTTYNNLPQGSFSVTSNHTTRTVTLLFNLNETATMNLSIWTQNNNQAQLVAQGTTTGSSGSVSVNVPVQYGNATYSAVIYKGNQFVATRVVDLSESANDYFGSLGLFLGALAVLVLALIGASHGEWVIVWTIVGMITVSILYLVDLPWYALLTFIAGAGVFLIKLVSRRRVA